MQSSEKKVSVIIPIYNAENYIRRCADSVINQDFGFENINLIFVNDLSTDNTINILNHYKAKYPNSIQIIDKSVNEGQAAARDDGISIVETPYFMFIDNDDFIDKDFISNYYKIMEKEKSDLLIGGFRRVNENNQVVAETRYAFSKGKNYGYPSIWGSMHRTEFIVSNNIHYRERSADDIGFVFQEYLHTNNVIFFEYIGYNWFERDDSLSRGGGPSINIEVPRIISCLNVMSTNNPDRNYQYDYYTLYIIFYTYYLLRERTYYKDFLKYWKVIKKEILKVYPNYYTKYWIAPYNTEIKIKLFMVIMKIVFIFKLMPFFSYLVCKKEKNE